MIRVSVQVLLLVVATGCATEVDVQDHSVLMPTLRASKKLNDRWKIDLIADYAEGSDRQTLAPSEFVEIGGVTLSGNLDVDFNLTTVRAEGRFLHDISEKWLVEALFGAALYYVDVTASDATATGNDDQVVFGPHGGARIGWRPAPRVQLYTELYGMVGLPDAVTPLFEFEAGAEFLVAGPVSVFGGWKFRNLEVIRGDSNFDLEWSGAFLGLGFDF